MAEPVDMVGGLMREVAATQKATLAQRSVLGEVLRRPPVRRSALSRMASRLPRLRFAIPALAVAGAAVLWFGPGDLLSNQAPLSFLVGAEAGLESTAGKAGDRLEAAQGRPLPLRFSDGSQVTLNRGAQVQVAAVDSRGATLNIERGRADVDIHHRPNTRWRLRAGSFEVTVTGTKFSIEWEQTQGALTVVMTEGAVEVRGPAIGGGAPVVVSAGQRLRATSHEPRWTMTAAAPVPSPSPTESETDPTATAPTEAAPAPVRAAANSVPAPRTWQTLARAGRYQEALRMVERSGFEHACRRLGAEDLVQLGDAARLARNPARAESAYRAARNRFPDSDRPAFALGLVAFEQRRDFKAAARWFDTYVRQYPNGALAREAAGREMESWHRAGENARARRAARDYLDQAPSGPYAPLARQISAP